MSALSERFARDPDYSLDEVIKEISTPGELVVNIEYQPRMLEGRSTRLYWHFYAQFRGAHYRHKMRRDRFGRGIR